jgi:hypothetical protein
MSVLPAELGYRVVGINLAEGMLALPGSAARVWPFHPALRPLDDRVVGIEERPVEQGVGGRGRLLPPGHLLPASSSDQASVALVQLQTLCDNHPI